MGLRATEAIEYLLSLKNTNKPVEKSDDFMHKSMPEMSLVWDTNIDDDEKEINQGNRSIDSKRKQINLNWINCFNCFLKRFLT